MNREVDELKNEIKSLENEIVLLRRTNSQIATWGGTLQAELFGANERLRMMEQSRMESAAQHMQIDEE